MKIESDQDFDKIEQHIRKYKKNFPIFIKDIKKIENTIEQYKKDYGNFMVAHRQNKNRASLERAQEQINKISHLLDMLDKIELFALMAKHGSR